MPPRTEAEPGLSMTGRRAAKAAAAILLALSCAAPALAGWREDMKTFRIGMIAEDGAGQTVPGLSTLKRAYSQALGLPAEIFVARDYASLIDAQASGRVDYAIYSASAYATASLLCACVEPVVAPVGADGTTGIVAILVTRDGRLKDLSELSRRRVAVGPEDSVAGFMLPQLGLAGQAIALDGSPSHIVRADSQAAAEAMLADGSVDAIFGWAPAGTGPEVSGGTLDRLVAAGVEKSSLAVVWRSPPLRYGPHALRTGLDVELRRVLVTFLTRLKALQPDVYDLLETRHGGGFVEVAPQDYATAVDMVSRANGDGAGH
jgi:phosphonate transport system substrate-binding protein